MRDANLLGDPFSQGVMSVTKNGGTRIDRDGWLEIFIYIPMCWLVLVLKTTAARICKRRSSSNPEAGFAGKANRRDKSHLERKKLQVVVVLHKYKPWPLSL